jgi:hypothetical protein
MTKSVWHRREKTLESGTVLRWRERDLGNGEVERVYDDAQTRDAVAQTLSVTKGS